MSVSLISFDGVRRTLNMSNLDLAGSEMTKKTQSEGKTLEEANNINKRSDKRC